MTLLLGFGEWRGVGDQLAFNTSSLTPLMRFRAGSSNGWVGRSSCFVIHPVSHAIEQIVRSCSMSSILWVLLASVHGHHNNWIECRESSPCCTCNSPLVFTLEHLVHDRSSVKGDLLYIMWLL